MPVVKVSPGAAFRAPDDDVGDAVAVDVAGAAHRDAGIVPTADAVEDEAVGAVEIRELKAGREPATASEDHVAGALVAHAPRIDIGRAYDHVVDAVAVDVARRAHRGANAIARIDAVDDEAVVTVEPGHR